MSTLLVAAALLLAVAAAVHLLIQSDQRKQRFAMNAILQQFREAGARNGLSFSGQEVLKHFVIGIDGVHRKLLLLQSGLRGSAAVKVVSLEDLRSCSVKWQYGTISGGNHPAPLEQYLRELTLCLEKKNGEAIAIPFYDHRHHHISELSALDRKARYWEALLSKLITPLRKTA